MSLELTSRRTGRRAGWSRVLGLVLVPLTVAGVLLWGLWNPQDRLDTVTAAVVNLDEPVELDGQLVPLGRLLAGELIGAPGGAEDADSESAGRAAETENFDWVLTDESDAAEGLSEGRYATVVTIPDDFSAAATSLSGGDPDEARTATIDIAESDRGRLIDTALSNIVTSTATNVLNRQLGEQFVGGVFVGMGELSTGIGEAADGASQLAGGGRQLADGATRLADGTSQLAAGTQELANGAGSLSNGTSELAGGASQLASGATGLAGGLGAFVYGDGTPANPGLQGYAAGTRGFVSGDGSPTNPGLVTYLGGVDQYASGVGGALTQVRDGLQSGAGELIAYRDGIAGGTIAPPAGVDPQAMVAALDQAIALMQSEASQQQLEQLNGLIDASGGIAAGARGYAAGAEGIASGAEQLAGGGAALAAGANQLAGGATELSGGAAQLADGASQLSAGTSELASGAPQLADGATQLADGATQAASGAGDLAQGLDEAAAGIPDYTSAQRDRIAQTALAPVEAKGASSELFNASGVPLFAGIALWAGALALALLATPLWSRTRDAARGIGWIALRSARPAALLGALQGAIAGAVLPFALGYDFSQGLRFFGVALVAGIAFALSVQGLSALFGGIGRFIAFALLVVAFATGIVSTAPAALTAIGDASPVGAALGGFQAIATGGAAGGAVMLLALWGLGGLALTAFAVARARRAR
ncbi:YhgE/Pip domain-containing protein [Leucobacter sp. gxy201]|uniref:YhgE/Pip domain-containing protein n=1 Tax=Leucobacter sp. gxy201 TaxID=2957200 RepID=UPI003D9FEECB